MPLKQGSGRPARDPNRRYVLHLLQLLLLTWLQIGLAQTRDFLHIERVALTTAIDYRNCVLFPEKIDGLYVRFERPNIGNPGIWISYSPI